MRGAYGQGSQSPQLARYFFSAGSSPADLAINQFLALATSACSWSSEHSPAAAAARLNVMGTQFHPEKSGENGLKVYSGFLEFCGAG